MTATEELRRMLDERGVEYEGGERSLRWRDRYGIMMQAFPLANGELGMGVWSCTPEQAIAATLGMREQPPYDELIEVLRRDWQIEASWDGLRRVWYVGWTDEHVESCAECARGLGAYADSLCDPLKAENAKLREMCVSLYEFAMSEYPDGTELNFADRMRELGVEVNE